MLDRSCIQNCNRLDSAQLYRHNEDIRDLSPNGDVRKFYEEAKASVIYLQFSADCTG